MAKEYIIEEWDRKFVERLANLVGDGSAARQALDYAAKLDGPARFFQTNRGTLLVLADDPTKHN